MSASETPYSSVKVVVNAEGTVKGFMGGRIAECYRGRHDSAARRDRGAHVDRGRAASRPGARPRGRLRRGPDLPEKPAAVGGEASRGGRGPGVRRRAPGD